MKLDLQICISLYKKTKEQLNRMLNSIPSDYPIRIDIDGWTPDYDIYELSGFKKHSEIIVVRHKTNHGLGWIRNTQIVNCKHQFIEFADADDYFESHAFRMLEKEVDSTRYDLIATSSGLTDFNHYVVLDRNLKVAQGNGQTYFVIPSLIFKTKFLLKNNLYFDESRHIFEDVIFSIRLTALKPKVTCLSKPFYSGTDVPLTGESLSHPEDITPVIESTFYVMDEIKKLKDVPKSMTYIRMVEECYRILKLTDDHDIKMRALEYLKPYKYF